MQSTTQVSLLGTQTIDNSFVGVNAFCYDPLSWEQNNETNAAISSEMLLIKLLSCSKKWTACLLLPLFLHIFVFARQAASAPIASASTLLSDCIPPDPRRSLSSCCSSNSETDLVITPAASQVTAAVMSHCSSQRS